MTSYLRFLFHFILFRSSPADAPAERQFLWATGLAAVLINFLTNGVIADPVTRLLFATAQILVPGLLIYVLLTFRQRTARWPQTIASIWGADALLELASWPLLPWNEHTGDANTPAFTAYAATFVIVWYVALMARALHLSLEVKPAFAFLLTFLCTMLSGLILPDLFSIPVPVQSS